MKKLFTFVVALMTVAAVNATQVVLNPADMPQLTTDGGAAYNETIGGISVQITKGIVNDSQIRIYKNQTLTITAQSDISAIVFTCTASGTSQYGPGCFAEQEGYTYELNKGTWDGSAKSVSFNAESNQVRATQIVVYLDGEKPASGETKVDTIGVSQAIARIKNGQKESCYVLGVVAGDPFTLGANGPAFYMTDIENAADSLEGFKIGKDANTPYASAEAMAADFGMGDTILIFALGLDKYKEIYETTSGYFCKVVGKSAAVVLDWATGTAYRESTGWTLEIAKGNNDQNNLVNLKISSTKKDAIAGSYPLAAGSEIVLNGAKTAITAGNVKLTFKEIGVNSLNIYNVQATFTVGDKVYRIMSDVEFYAVDENSEEIALVGDRPFKPTEGQEITCAQAREYALSLASGTTGDVKVTVVGYVTDLFSNGVTFWMDDQQGSAKTFQAYMVKTVQPAGVGLKNGAKVKVTGYVTNFSGTTPELKDGAVEIVEGGEQIVATEVTVAEALAAAKALEQNKTSEGVYAITGYISAIAEEFKADKGNMSFWMSDNLNDAAQEFQAFRVSCTEDLAAKLRPGAKVKVTAKITHFHQDAKPATDTEEAKPERTIYETVQGGTVELLAVSGVEDVMSNAPAVKFIENGQIYIIRNGVRYNLQGQVAE